MRRLRYDCDGRRVKPSSLSLSQQALRKSLIRRPGFLVLVLPLASLWLSSRTCSWRISCGRRSARGCTRITLVCNNSQFFLRSVESMELTYPSELSKR
jgi:hypothetical protein